MKKKMLILLVMVMITSVFLSACSETAPTEQPASEAPQETPAEAPEASTEQPVTSTAPGESLTIGVSINALANVHNREMFEFTEKYIKEAGHAAVMVNANGHAVQQVTDIENLIQQNVDVIIIQNGDTESLRNVVQEAVQKNIPVISMDSGWIPGVSSMFAKEDFSVAAAIYSMLAAEMGYEGQIIAINHNDHPAIRIRRNVQEAVLREYTNIEKVVNVTSGFPGTVELAYAGVESALQAYPDVKAIWCTFDLEAIGAAQAAKAAGRDDILIVGVDGELEAFEMIADGGPIIATVVADLVTAAQQSVDVAERLAYGESVRSFYPIPFEIVTKENVDKYLP